MRISQARYKGIWSTCMGVGNLNPVMPRCLQEERGKGKATAGHKENRNGKREKEINSWNSYKLNIFLKNYTDCQVCIYRQHDCYLPLRNAKIMTKQRFNRNASSETDCPQVSEDDRNGPGDISHIWPIRGCAAGQGMAFGFSVVDSEDNFGRLCIKQGIFCVSL